MTSPDSGNLQASDDGESLPAGSRPNKDKELHTEIGSWDGCHFGECELELADFEDAVRQEPRTRALTRTCTTLGAAACCGGVYLLTTPHFAAGCLTLSLGVALGMSERAADHAARRWFARTPPAERHLRFTLGPHGLIVAGRQSRVLHPWPSLYAFHPTRRSLLVWVSPRLFLVLPRRAFRTSELPAITRNFEQRVGSPPQTPRFLAWLGLTLALAGLLLWTWNQLAPR